MDGIGVWQAVSHQCVPAFVIGNPLFLFGVHDPLLFFQASRYTFDAFVEFIHLHRRFFFACRQQRRFPLLCVACLGLQCIAEHQIDLGVYFVFEGLFDQTLHLLNRIVVLLLADEAAEDADLYELGMTSHASVEVMLALEDSFGIEFPDRMLRREVFESVGAILVVAVPLPRLFF